jgi:hypothetical protein
MAIDVFDDDGKPIAAGAGSGETGLHQAVPVYADRDVLERCGRREVQGGLFRTVR